jgi:hypothetical protein
MLFRTGKCPSSFIAGCVSLTLLLALNLLLLQ